MKNQNDFKTEKTLLIETLKVGALILAVLIGLCTFAARSATVSGEVRNAFSQIVTNAPVVFYPLSNPQSDGGLFLTSLPVSTVTDTNGQFAVTMEQGDYRVVINGRDKTQISVPNDANAYSLEDLISQNLTYVYPTVPSGTIVPLAGVSTSGKVFTTQADDYITYGKTAQDMLFNAIPVTYEEQADVDWSAGATNMLSVKVDYAGTAKHMPFKPDTVRPEWFGADGTDATDDTAAIQAAINAAGIGGTLYIPSGQWLVSSVTITNPITIVGASHSALMDPNPNTGSSGDPLDYHVGGTMIKAIAGGSNYVFNIDVTTSPGGSSNPIGRNAENHLYSVNLRNLHFDGDDRSVDKGAIWVAHLDHSLWENLNFTRVAREAINFYTSCRESTFRDLRFRFCGNGSTYPQISIIENGTADPHNNLWFENTYSIYGMGDHVKIGQTAGTGQVRNIFFRGGMFHGIVASIDGADYTFTSAQKASRHFVIEGGRDVGLFGLRTHVTGLDVPSILINTNSVVTNYPSVYLTDSEISEHYTGTSDSYGIDLITGDLTVDSVRWRGHADGNLRVRTNGTVRYGPNQYIITGVDVFDDGGTFSKWDSKGDLDMNQNDIDFVANLQVSNIESLNASSALILKGQQTSTASAIALQTKDGGGTLQNTLVIGDGANPVAKFITGAVLDVTTVTNSRAQATLHKTEFDSAAAWALQTLNEAETAVQNAVVVGGGAGNRNMSLAVNLDINGFYIEGVERSTPSAPPANSGYIYFKDNGAGKTQLVVQFNTGGEIVLATQP